MIVRLGVRLAEICFDPVSNRRFVAIPDNSREGTEFRAVLSDVSVPTERPDAERAVST